MTTTSNAWRAEPPPPTSGPALPDRKLVPGSGSLRGDRVQRSKLYQLIQEGKIRIKKDGNCTFILRGELERYLNSL